MIKFIVTAFTVGALVLSCSAAAWASWLHERYPRKPYYLRDEDGDIIRWEDER